LINVDLRVGRLPEALADFEAGAFHAALTDPPYGLGQLGPGRLRAMLNAWLDGQEATQTAGMLGRSWDVVVGPPTWAEIRRVCRPGALIFAYSHSRTAHYQTLAMELGGWRILPQWQRIHGGAMALGQHVGKAIDKAAGAEREVIGRNMANNINLGIGGGYAESAGAGSEYGVPITAPTTPLAQRFEGYSTATRNAVEPIVSAVNPPAGSWAGNAEAHGCGGFNVGGSRIPSGPDHAIRCGWVVGQESSRAGVTRGKMEGARGDSYDPRGRYPSNVLLQTESLPVYALRQEVAHDVKDAIIGYYEGLKGHPGVSWRQGPIHMSTLRERVGSVAVTDERRPEEVLLGDMSTEGHHCQGSGRPGGHEVDGGRAGNAEQGKEEDGSPRGKALQVEGRATPEQRAHDGHDLNVEPRSATTGPDDDCVPLRLEGQGDDGRHAGASSSQGGRRTPQERERPRRPAGEFGGDGPRGALGAPQTDGEALVVREDMMVSAWARHFRHVGEAPGSETAFADFPARFYYQGRASREERHRGAEGLLWRRAPNHPDGWELVDAEMWRELPGSERFEGSPHLAVKAADGGSHLASLLRQPDDDDTPPRLLVPYAGTGSEVIAAMLAGWRDIVAVEMSPQWAEVARRRIAWWQEKIEAGSRGEALAILRDWGTTPGLAPVEDDQLDLFGGAP
jgi:hypothetical protein